MTGSSAPLPPTRRAAGWWLAAGALVLGLLVGGIVVGLASGGSSDLDAPVASAGATAPGTTAPTPGDATAQVSVNASCLRALNAAQDTYTAINDLADAASTLNAARLDEIIRRLQPLQGRLQQDLRSCQVVTRLPDGSVSSGPVPTPAPTS